MKSLNIRFSGSGGQGLILAARILAAALVNAGRNVAQSQSYEPVSRGGLSRSDLVITDGEAPFPLCQSLDYLLVLDVAAAGISQGLLSSDALVLQERDMGTAVAAGHGRTLSLPFAETARRLGNRRVANIVALGALCGSSRICPDDEITDCIRTMTPTRFGALNIEAFLAGQDLTSAAMA